LHIMTPTEVRLRLVQHGYQPLPVNGKIPALVRWQKRTGTSSGDIEIWARTYPGSANTSILCSTVPVLDIDVLDPDAAAAVEAVVRERFEGRGAICVRFGQPPKRAIFFQTAAPFGKNEIKLVAPNGDTGQKIEFLCAGQQCVVDGTHPVTGKAYSWFGASLCETHRDELPQISEAETHTLLDDISRLLVDAHGGGKCQLAIPLREHTWRLRATRQPARSCCQVDRKRHVCRCGRQPTARVDGGIDRAA
jgi:hypothetical protein